MTSSSYQALGETIGYTFRELSLLQQALTHASLRLREGHTYERLEFLGDAVLGMTVAEHLFRNYPDMDEGSLTRMKSSIVCGPVLAEAARRLRLEDYVIADKGVAASGLPESVLSDVYESLVGAMCLDGGIEEARKFILSTLGEEIRGVADGKLLADSKSLLQHHAQRNFACDPIYRIIEQEGPAHRKRFRAAVRIGDAEYSSDWAYSKATAEQDAAAVALRALGVPSEGEPTE